LKIIRGPLKGFSGFFEKLQTLPYSLSRAILSVEILGTLQKLKIELSQPKKMGA
jgi:transcription antitermination factor NusG